MEGENETPINPEKDSTDPVDKKEIADSVEFENDQQIADIIQKLREKEYEEKTLEGGQLDEQARSEVEGKVEELIFTIHGLMKRLSKQQKELLEVGLKELSKNGELSYSSYIADISIHLGNEKRKMFRKKKRK